MGSTTTPPPIIRRDGSRADTDEMIHSPSLGMFTFVSYDTICSSLACAPSVWSISVYDGYESWLVIKLGWIQALDKNIPKPQRRTND